MTIYTYFFYESLADAESDIFITAPVGYINSTNFNSTIYYKKINANNCESIGRLNLEVIPTLTSSDNQKNNF